MGSMLCSNMLNDYNGINCVSDEFSLLNDHYEIQGLLILKAGIFNKLCYACRNLLDIF